MLMALLHAAKKRLAGHYSSICAYNPNTLLGTDESQVIKVSPIPGTFILL